MHHVDLDTIVLEHGSHATREKGVCLLEAVAWWAEEPHSDKPQCVSPVIAAFGRRWNDDLDDEGRQTLRPFIPKMVGTNTGAADDERRAWMVTDWMVRTYLPAWLRLAKLDEQADAVAAALPELADRDGWRVMEPTVVAARSAANAAWDAARDAAWDAAGAAAGAAARAAAWDAARDAAWDAARDAAWAAAWDAARAAAGAAARAAAGAAARAAAWDAARAAAGAALRPTVVGLQASARDLLDRMIQVGAEVTQ